MFKHYALIAALPFVVSSAFAGDIPTRFGALKINDENVLLYKNRPLNPEIQGNNSLSVVGTYQLGNSDVVLVQNNGGTDCPALLYFVTVSASGVKATPAFGTCNDLINVKQIADSISVTMPGFMGPFESKAAQRKAAKDKHVYVFKDGGLAEADSTMTKPSASPVPKTTATPKAGTNSSKTNIIVGDGNALAVVQFLELYQGYALAIKEARASGRYSNKATCLAETKAMWRNVLQDSPSLINLDSVTIEGNEFPALWKACT